MCSVTARLLCSWDYSHKNTESGLPFLPPGDLPDPGIEPTSPALTGKFFIIEPPGKLKHEINNEAHFF